MNIFEENGDDVLALVEGEDDITASIRPDSGGAYNLEDPDTPFVPGHFVFHKDGTWTLGSTAATGNHPFLTEQFTQGVGVWRKHGKTIELNPASTVKVDSPAGSSMDLLAKCTLSNFL